MASCADSRYPVPIVAQGAHAAAVAAAASIAPTPPPLPDRSPLPPPPISGPSSATRTTTAITTPRALPAVTVSAQTPPRSSSLPLKPVISRDNIVANEVSSKSEASKQDSRAEKLARSQSVGLHTNQFSSKSELRKQETCPEALTLSQSVTFHTNQHRWSREDERLESRSPGFLELREGRKGVFNQPPIFRYSHLSHYLEYSHSRRFMQALLVNEGIAEGTGHPDYRAADPSKFVRSHSEPRRWSSIRSVGRRKDAIQRAVSGKRESNLRFVTQETPGGVKYRRIVMNEVDWKVSPTAVSLSAEKEVYGKTDEGQYATSDTTGSTFKVNESANTKIVVEADLENRGIHATTMLHASGESLPKADGLLPRDANAGAPPESKLGKRRSWGIREKVKGSEADPKTPPPRLPVSFPRSESLHFDSKKFPLEDGSTITKDTDDPIGAASVDFSKFQLPGSLAITKDTNQLAVEPSIDLDKFRLPDDLAVTGDAIDPTGKLSEAPMTKINPKPQPNVRDFASSTSTNLAEEQTLDIRARHSMIFHRLKDTLGHRELMYDRKVDSRQSNNPTFVSEQPLQRSLSLKTFQDIQEASTLGSTASNRNSKSPSILSTASITEHCQSDVYSGVLENAQRMPMQRGTARGPSTASSKTSANPGPPPRMALPLVPEGEGNFAPVTPRNSMSEQRNGGVERPEAKSNSSPENYSPFPKSSPRRRSQSPTKRSTHGRQDSSNHKAAARVIISNGISNTLFPAPPSPERTRPSEEKKRDDVVVGSTRMPAELPGMEVRVKPAVFARAEKARDRKTRDIARQKSQKAEVEQHEPVAPKVPGSKTIDNHTDVTNGRPPTPFLDEEHASFDIVSEYSEKRSDPEETSAAPKKSHQRDNSALSQISPIIVVAEQPPVAPIQRASTQKVCMSLEDPKCRSVSAEAQEIQHSPAGQSNFLGDLGRAQFTASAAIPRPVKPRPAAPCRDTPLIPDRVRKSSDRSSQCSSVLDSNIEARISKLEELIRMVIFAGADVGTRMSAGDIESRYSRGDVWHGFDRRDNGNENAVDDRVHEMGFMADNRRSGNDGKSVVENGSNGACIRHVEGDCDGGYH